MESKHRTLFGLLGLYLSMIKSCQSFSRSSEFTASSKKSLWQLKKKESLGANVSMSNPLFTAASTYSSALAIVNATSCIAVESGFSDVISRYKWYSKVVFLLHNIRIYL